MISRLDFDDAVRLCLFSVERKRGELSFRTLREEGFSWQVAATMLTYALSSGYVEKHRGIVDTYSTTDRGRSTWTRRSGSPKELRA